MNSFTINNSSVSINVYDDAIGNAKDQLLTKLYYARNKDTMGQRAGWEKLLHMYYMKNYYGMKEYISSFHGRGGRTRNECLHLLDTIIKGGI